MDGKRWTVGVFLLIILSFLFFGTALGETNAFMSAVRVVNLSPNAHKVDLHLYPTHEGDGEQFTHEQWQNLEYLDVSDYHDIFPGSYAITVTVDAVTLTKDTRFQAGNYYTIDLSGLVIPEALEELAEKGLGAGFLGWLHDIVLGENREEAVLFQPRVLHDNPSPVTPNSLRVRLVHAAPGVEDVNLVYVGTGKKVCGPISYGHHSDHEYLYPKDGLEVSFSSTGVILPNAAPHPLPLTNGSAHTVFVVGTPVDISAPALDFLILTNPVFDSVDLESLYPLPLEEEVHGVPST